MRTSDGKEEFDDVARRICRTVITGVKFGHQEEIISTRVYAKIQEADEIYLQSPGCTKNTSLQTGYPICFARHAYRLGQFGSAFRINYGYLFTVNANRPKSDLEDSGSGRVSEPNFGTLCHKRGQQWQEFTLSHQTCLTKKDESDPSYSSMSAYIPQIMSIFSMIDLFTSSS